MNELINIKTDKFKNTALSVTIPLKLDKYVTDYNLISSILKRGSRTYPSTKEIWKHLEELYGAVFDIVVSKKGEKLFLNFYISFINNKYAINGEDVFKKSVEFLTDVINSPLIIDGRFKDEYFEQEKDNLRILINSRIDNKDEYVIEKALEICCSEEPYSIYKYGSLERLEEIDNGDLIDVWNKNVKKSKAYIISCGNMEDNLSRGKLSGLVNSSNDSVEESEHAEYKKQSREVVEKMKVNQGKFAMCFRTNNTILNGDYFALAVMNSILGGGTHSKLFNEVREKHSLAYYCYSFIEKFKGLMVITAGVDSSKFKNARDISIEQLEKIKNGVISDQEFNSSRTKLVSDLRTVEDSQYNTIDYIGALRAYNVNYNICDIIEGIEKVTVDRVIEAAKKVELDTVYFLDSEE